MAREKQSDVLRILANRKRKHSGSKADDTLVDFNHKHPATKKSFDHQIKKKRFFGGDASLLSVDLANDVTCYLRYLERKNEVPENFLVSKQPLIDGRMRKTLVVWLVQLQLRFNLVQETLSMAVWILDRSFIYLNKHIHKDNLQLLGAASLFIAAKFEEVFFPSCEDLVYAADSAFTKPDILRMEMMILQSINFKCAMSHSVQFLRRYRRILGLDRTMYNLGKLICDVALVEYALAHLKSSTVAAASLFLAAVILEEKIQWSQHIDEFGIDPVSLALITSLFVQPLLELCDTSGKYFGLQLKHRTTSALPFSRTQTARIYKFESNPIHFI